MTFQCYGHIDSDSPLYQHRKGVANGQEIADLPKYIVKACLDAATDGVQNYFIINGSYQSGKTSMLVDIAHRIKAAGGYVCWLDFQQVSDATLEQALVFIARQIFRAIPELGAMVKVPDKFENAGFEFDHWLWELPIPEGKPVVLLFEELRVLRIDTRKSLGGLLRGAFGGRRNTTWDKVVLVFFGGIELDDMRSIGVSPLYNICMNISLSDLSPSASQSLVKSGFDKAGNFDAAELKQLSESIYNQVSGHPYLTQYLGNKALEHYQRNGILPVDIQPLLSQPDMEDLEYFQYLYKFIQEYNLTEVTKSLLQKQLKNHPDKNAIHKLELLGVLGQKTETSISFRNRLTQVTLKKIITAHPEDDGECITGQYENEVFVSYAWGGKSERTVNELEQAFASHGISIVRDKKDLGYKGSIKEFEQRIGKGQCVILVISDKYLRSEHCMYELVEIGDHREFRKRVFPIVLVDASFYKAIDRMEYINHWNSEIKKLSKAMRKVKVPSDMKGIAATLDKYMRIRARFDDLTDLLSDMNALTPDIHTASGFATLIKAVETAQKRIRQHNK